MGTTTDRARKIKAEFEGGAGKVKRGSGNEASEVVHDRLEILAHEGAREMLCRALSEEVGAYLGRGRYERSDEHRGYRNGSTSRKLTLGTGTVDLAVPRVRDLPANAEPFESKVVRKYQRRSDTIDATFMYLFVEGLATRDFEPACWIADGALGLWAAIDEQSPRSAQQRCTNHKTMNAVDKLPLKERPTWVPRVRAIWQADSEKAARRLAAALVRDPREAGVRPSGGLHGG